MELKSGTLIRDILRTLDVETLLFRHVDISYVILCTLMSYFKKIASQDFWKLRFSEVPRLLYFFAETRNAKKFQVFKIPG